jgi:hypothetical protein
MRLLLCAGPILLASLLFCSNHALAQDDYWRLGESARELTESERRDLKELPGRLKSLPQDVLKIFLKEEGKHLESLTKEQIEAFAKEAKARFQAHGARHLMESLRILFKSFAITSKRVLAIVYREELRRLNGIPQRLFNKLLSEAYKRVIADRMKRLSNIKLDLIKADKILNGPRRSYGWKYRSSGHTGRSNRLIGDLVLLAKEDKFVKTLFSKELKGRFGTLKMKAAHIEGLTKIKAGKLSFTDDFGRVHEGLGARFTIKTKFTVASADARSERFDLLKNQPVNVSAMVLARVFDVGTEAELDSSSIISKDGLILHNEARAGASIKASVQLPIDIDLKLFKIRLTPYVEAHAGVGAKAHFNLEIEWSGRLAIDVGAAYSLGLGSGAGLRLEIMAGPLIEKVLGRLQRALVSIFRPIFDSLRGIREFGPAFESGKTTLSMAELTALISASSRAGRLTLDQVAQRYAPVLYQRIKRAPHDYIRKVDFDGDFDAANNWQNSNSGGQKAYIYWDVKETKTHYYITYSWFYARRESGGISFLRFINQHENDMAGVVVMVRKNASPLNDIEMVMSSNGHSFHAYSASKKTRWKAGAGEQTLLWNGAVKFVDEVDHPMFDHERVHPQIYCKPHSHDVSVYNGRDDRDGFEGKDGVVYYYTGTAEKPESSRDRMVPYALKPISDLLDKANKSHRLFAKKSIKIGPESRVLPKSFRGKVGLDNSALPPWSWGYERDDADSDAEAVTVIAPGAMFADPAATISSLFKVPGPFSKRYIHNNMLKKTAGPSNGVDTEGIRGGLRRSRRP